MSQLVQRDEDISSIANGQFIFCKELKKGFIKKDISVLGVVTFEAVVAKLEGATFTQLQSWGLDSK